ncbi:MAG: T9SS type A sorting domain-containing protein [Bacteroidales bacterium]|nr:T9SS type A sorting domain-containing protein [Bacteroidales bacterium]
MKKLLLALILFSILSNRVFSQNFILSNSITSSSKVRTAELKKVSDGVLYYGDFIGTLNVTGNPSADVRDIFLAKYNDSFELEWIQQIGGTLKDWAYDLVVHDNYIYIVGRYQGTCIFDGGAEVLSALGIVYDSFLAKYKLDGTFVWAKPFAYNEADQQATTIDVDKNDDLIIGGFYTDSITFEIDKFISANGMFYSKADTSGALLWVENIPTDNTGSKIQAISAFDDGYYFTGNVEGAATFDIGGIASNDPLFSDVFLYKTGFTGTGSWLRKTYGYGSADTKTGTITGDDYGNIYFTGLYGGTYIEVDENSSQISSQTLVNNGSLDAFIIKYNKTGDLSWHYNYGNAGEEWARDIEFKNGFLYLTGYFSDTLFVENDTLISSDPLDYDAILGMFDSEGNMLRAAHIEDANDGTTSGIALSVDSENNAYWGGDFKASQITIGDSTFNKSGIQSGFISKYKPTYTVAFTKKQNLTCNGDSDGELIVTPYFGVPPFNYNWSHDVGLNDSTATGLPAGRYTVTVTDFLDSIATIFYDITEPDAFIFDPTITDVTTCSYNSNGAIDLNVSGGNGGNTYFWIGEETENIEDQTGLGIGSFYVTVTDTEGCTNDTAINITGPEPVIFNGTLVTDDSGVDPIHNGAIDLVLVGGSTTPANYGASWTGPSGYNAATQDISSLAAGTYYVTVTDENSCLFDSSFTVVDLDTLFAYISNKKDDCTGLPGDGTAQVSYYTPNATAVISYSWSHDGGLNDSVATGLAAGLYYVTVTDSDLSETSVDSVQILDLGYTMTGDLDGTLDVNCKGDSDGYIDLTVITPGQSPYLYEWSNGDTTQDIINLPAATYSVTVTDDNACTLQISNYTISEPALDLTVPPPGISSYILCYGDLNGALLADPSGGNGGYTYKWNDPGDQTSNPATGLEAGFYTVTVTDSKLCTASSGVNLTQPDVLTVSGIIGDLTCFDDNSGTIALTVGGGTPSYDYFWSTSDGNGLAVVDKNQNGLSAGSYEVTITDGNLCEVSDTFIAAEPLQIQIDTENKTDITTCNGDATGTITITASGGTGVLTYTLNPGAVQTNTTGIFYGLIADTYTVDVDDDNNCGPVKSSSIAIAEPLVITIDSENSTDASSQTTADGTITITASGGTGNLTFTLKPDNTSNQTGIFTSILPEDYTVEVSDENDCGPLTSGIITVSFPDAIEDILANDRIRIYPNPTSDKIFIEVDIDNDNLSVEVLSVSGQILLNKVIKSNGVTKDELDLSSYPKGVYFIRIFNNQFNFTDKILLQ